MAHDLCHSGINFLRDLQESVHMESSLAMLAFVRAVECKGFTAAAVDMGVTPSACLLYTSRCV